MSIGKSSLLFSAGTFISRLSGLVRDTVVAGIFGAGALLDAFIVANRIPNLFRDMLAEGALGSSFTKVFSSLCETDRIRAKTLLAAMLKLGFALTILISVAGYILAPFFVEAFTFMSDPSERGQDFYDLTTSLTRLLFPFLGIALLSSITMGALHQSGRFFISAVSPIFLNVGYILGATLIAWYLETSSTFSFLPEPSITGLALGVLIGGASHFFLQLYFVTRDFRLLIPKDKAVRDFIRPLKKDILNVLVIMGPAVIAASAAPINLLVNTNFATSLENGAVSWLNYAFRLLQLPVGLFGVAIGSAILPALSRSIARAHNKIDATVSAELQNGLEMVIWCMVPCMCFLLINCDEIVTLIFQHGRFDVYAAARTSEVLFAYSFAVIAYGLIKVLTAFYFASERTKFAMFVSLSSIGINFIANYFLVQRFSHVGLAAATAMTLTMNAVILLLGLASSKPQFHRAKALKSLFFVILSAILALITQIFCEVGLGSLDLGGFPSKVSSGVSMLANGILVFMIFCILAMVCYGWSFQNVFSRFKNIRRR